MTCRAYGAHCAYRAGVGDLYSTLVDRSLGQQGARVRVGFRARVRVRIRVGWRVYFHMLTHITSTHDEYTHGTSVAGMVSLLRD